MTRYSTIALLIATTVFAAAQKPKLAVHPLVLEGVDSKKDRDDLTALLPGIIIAVGKVEIASPSDVDAELKKKGQAFCSPENLFKCLSYIADHTSSVHAIRVELRRGGRPNSWEIVANVVCVDGSVQRQPDVFVFTQSESVKFLPIARAKLEEFIATLKLSELPVSPPAKAVVAVQPPPDPIKTDKPVRTDVPPPPVVVKPAPEHGTSGVRMASYVLGATSVVTLGFSGVFAILAKVEADQIRVTSNGSSVIGVTRDQVDLAVRTERNHVLGASFLVAGCLIGATAITLFMFSDSPPDTVIAPTAIPGGAGVVFSSRF